MQNNDVPVVNSHNSWSPLQEVWLGDVYPCSWYDHLDPAIKDPFQAITEITKQDLFCIERELLNLGITVRRPVYDSIDTFIAGGHLVKPQICPRDHFLVNGNDLICHRWQTVAWRHIIDFYKTDRRIKVYDDRQPIINGANVVRAGIDLIIDSEIDYPYQDQFPTQRVHRVNNGGHLDGCFAILRPGLILANQYFNDYERTFPGWHIIQLGQPEFSHHLFPVPGPGFNGKWFLPDVETNRTFNEHIIKHAQDWVGIYTETYFELNCLVVNENTVIMLSRNEPLAEKLQSLDIDVIWVPFRTRSFWDGGVHCLTVDIRRQSTMIDYFPER